MKKTIYILSICIGLLGSKTANGQAALLVLIFGDQLATETFHLSIDGGINMVQTQGLGDGNKFGYHFGLGTHYNFAPKWQLVSEFTPINSGSVLGTPIIENLPDTIRLLLSEKDNEWKFNSIDIPILARYSLSDNFHIATGPIFSFITKVDEVRTAQYEPEGVEFTTVKDVKSSFNTFNMGVAFDLSYSLSTLRDGKGMDIRLRYNYYPSELMLEESGYSSNLSGLQFILTFPFIVSGDED